MQELLGSPGGAAALGGVGVFVCIAVIAVGCTVAVQWRKARQAELETCLKRDMLQLGMSADDIVKVLEASATAPEAALQREMLNKRSLRAIVKLLKARAAASPQTPLGETPLKATAEQQNQDGRCQPC
jgi:hypothetical protein